MNRIVHMNIQCAYVHMCIEWALWMYRGFTETKETSRRASMYRGISHSTLYTCKEISLYTCSWVRIPLYMQCIHEYLEVSLYMPLYIQRDIPLCMFVGSYPSIHAMYVQCIDEYLEVSLVSLKPLCMQRDVYISVIPVLCVAVRECI